MVDELGLTIQAKARTFPVVGAGLGRRWTGPGIAPPPLGLSQLGGWAWGGEKIEIARLEVPDDLRGVPLRLTALGSGRYRVQTGGTAIEGQVSVPAVAEAPGRVEVLVSELVARPGTQFTLVSARPLQVVEGLQRALKVGEKAKKSGVLAISLESDDPARAAAVLNSVARAYLRLSQERSAAEARQSLAVLEAQLPGRRAGVEAAEAALSAFQKRKRSMNLPLEGQAVLSQRVAIERELTQLAQQKAKLGRRYTAQHPLMQELDAKVRELQARQSGVSEALRQLPLAELDSARLTRDLQVANEQYLQLVREAEQLRVAQVGAGPRAAILDPASVPDQPSSPRPLSTLALAALLGLVGGGAAAFLKKGPADAERVVEQLEASSGVPVLARLAFSRAEAALARSARRHPGAALPVLVESAPCDASSEQLWGLRAQLVEALAGASGNLVAVLGPTAGGGRTFVSVNLASVLAAAGPKVLLADADLRSPGLHRVFGGAGQAGLAEVVEGAADLDAVLMRAGALDVLVAGAPKEHPAQLVAREGFERLLRELSERYDVVVLDTSAALSAAEALAVARLCSVNLLVVGATDTAAREALSVLRQLRQRGAGVRGLVVNEPRR
ncbi:MAG: GNVR domain-containing protein [Myxococcales bacterium]